MRKLAAIGLALTAAMLLSVGFASATGVEDAVAPSDGGHAVGVHYTWWGEEGQLEIVAEPGRPFAVRDAAGNAVAAGVLAASHHVVPARNVGFSPDGVIVHVDVGGDVVAVTDPEWEWN